MSKLFFNKSIKNLFSQNKFSSNAFLSYFPKKTFCSQIKEKQDLIINKNIKNEDELDVKIPADLNPYYSYGNLGLLPLYENTKDLSKFSAFCPAPKFNILLFSLFTYFSYGTTAFQPSLLLSLYLLKKYFLTNIGKNTQVLLLGLFNDGKYIFAKTFFVTYKFELSETKLKKVTKIGGTQYYELKNSTIKFPLILSSEGRILNMDLMESIFTGDVSKVNMIYS